MSLSRTALLDTAAATTIGEAASMLIHRDFDGFRIGATYREFGSESPYRRLLAVVAISISLAGAAESQPPSPKPHRPKTCQHVSGDWIQPAIKGGQNVSSDQRFWPTVLGALSCYSFESGRDPTDFFGTGEERVVSGRYVTLDSCAPGFCREKLLVWIDSASPSPKVLAAILTLNRSDSGKPHLWLLKGSSMNSALPQPALNAIDSWFNQEVLPSFSGSAVEQPTRISSIACTVVNTQDRSSSDVPCETVVGKTNARGSDGE